ncbi:uncharacterized protein LOC125014829 isoform X2 [Mugil cephalus]|uniref:uncharacterized protein LOC125014829 isoform X2 n=1 Tax=Mugil cephalus TaxID=48193 RepID=UPI001FB74751|nr:uncharacterized protein LOC125014829 isoform X2 [Mugil cephalus]
MLEGKKSRGSRHRSKASKTSSSIDPPGSAARKTPPDDSHGVSSAPRFSLLPERCTASPAPGPLASPLIGGLPGSSLLIGQQAAFLQLAQLKAHLALAQINNSFAVGGRATSLTANSKAPASYLSATPPSPTAAAINLLNVLKVANTMSHHLYNPYATGNQSSTQGQYGLSSSVQAERDPRSGSHLGSGSSFSSSGASSVTPVNSRGTAPSLLMPVNYRPFQNTTMIDKDIERSVEMHISRAREQVSDQSVGQGSRFTGTQRDKFQASSTGAMTYPMSSASQDHRPSDVETGRSSLNWLPNYSKAPEVDSSKFLSSSGSSSYPSSGDGRFNVSGGRGRNMESIPGLGDYNYPVPDKPAAPAESSRPKYTSESAASILLHFGLEKDDLEHLIAYPEDQITPDNLPFILRQIRIQKDKKTTGVAQSTYPEPKPTSSVRGMDRLGGSISAGMSQDKISSTILQPSKVIDYGHTGKYTGAVGEESGSGQRLRMDTYDSSGRSRKPPQKSMTEVTSRDQGASLASINSLYSSMQSSLTPPSSLSSTQLNQASQANLNTFKKDTDIRRHVSEVSKPVPLTTVTIEPQSSRQQMSTSNQSTKTQPTCTLFRGVHPGRPGLVLIGNNVTSRPEGQTNTKGQKPNVGGQMNEQATRQKIQQQQPVKQVQQQQAQKLPQHWTQQQQVHNQPVPPMGQPLNPAGFSAAKTVPPPPFIHGTSRPIPPAVFMPGDLRQTANPPPPAQPLPPLMNLLQMIPPPSNKEGPAQVVVSKGLPTAAMIHDYAAATPRVFPHTCCLCKKECTHVKDWISHQNTSLHLTNCRLLRSRYPDWDGEVLPLPSAPGKDAKPSPSTSAQTSQRRHQKTRHNSRSRSRSRSYSPHHRHDSEGRRDKRRSRPRSPHSSRHARRSRSRSWSPLYDRPTSSRYRSRSRSYERRLSPRRSREQRSPPRRSDEKRFSPRRSRERRDKKTTPQRKKSSSAERLAKKLLETSAVHSLSKDTDLEAVVKTLAPALLAELAKMKSPSSASVASTSCKTKSATKSNKSKPSQQKSDNQVSSANVVKLEKIYSNLSHKDVLTATEQFGKIKSVVLLRSKFEALVHFESEEDAKKLKTLKSFYIKEKLVFVATEEDSKLLPTSSAKELKKPPLKSAKSSVSTPKTTKPTSTGKAASSLSPGAKKNTTGKLVTKAKVLVSKAKNGSTKQITKTVKKDNVAAKGEPNTSKISEQQPDAGGPKQKQTAKVVKSQSLAQKNKDTDEKVLVSQAETTSTTPKPQVETSSAAGISQENSGNISPSKPTTITLPEIETLMPKAEVQESVVVPEVTTKAEPLDLEETGVTEPMEVESLAECKTENVTETKISPNKSNESPPTSCTVGTKPDTPSSEPPADHQKPESSVEAPEQNQPNAMPDPETKAQGLDTKTKALQMQDEGKMTEATLEAKAPESTQKDPAAKEVDSVTTEVAATAKTDLDSTMSPSNAATALTVGERIETLLCPSKIPCLTKQKIPFQRLVKLDFRVLLISNLPEYQDGCYTKEDVANVLIPFGFQYTDESIYVIPQARMAFALMPRVKQVQNIMRVSSGGNLVLNGSKLRMEVVKVDIPMTSFEFYTTLMILMRCKTMDTGARTIYIKNISHSEVRDLRETLRKIDSVRNFLPLLDEVFIEFDSIRDADRLGVWFSLLKKGFSFKVYRQKIPHSAIIALSPRLPANAFPDSSKDVVAGATIPATTFVVPKGSNAPFWVTMTTNPFVFPTMSPWFIIPEFLTISKEEDVESVGPRGSALSTIMLTGLPDNSYNHEDVAQLVWPYLPSQDLQSLYYNVTVLPLQRRAFVYFSSWDACCRFVRDHIKNPLCVTDSNIHVHVVLEDMNPGSSEETMYRSLMKWSNAHVPDLESLEERLLVVEISETTMDLVMLVMDVVASIASFVSFLPLANRICIEMAESSGVTQVVERIPSMHLSLHEVWSKVRLIEPLKSLKQRVQDSSGITINLGTDTVVINANPPTHETEPHPPPSDNKPAPPAGSTIPESVTTDSSDVEMTENDEKPETEISTDTNIVPTASKDVEKEEVKEPESPTTSPTASSSAPSSTALVQPEESVAELPHIDSDLAKAITAAVRQHRLAREIAAQNENRESPNKNDTSSRNVRDENTLQDKDQNDFGGEVSSDTLFDEQNFNLEDFVTVDEIGDDVEDTALDHRSSSASKQSSRGKQKRQSSDVSSASRQTSTRSSKDSKSSASTASSSTKPDKASVRSSSASLSPKRQKVSSEPIKSHTKSSPSASASESSASSSTRSTPTSPSKTVSPARASHPSSSPSSGGRTRSSKAASAAAVETPVESGQSSREGSKSRESAGEKSDSKVSSQEAAAEIVESETKIETEIHSPAQEPKSELLSRTQSLEIDSKDQTHKELNKSETEDTEKQTGEKESENDQTLDFPNDKMNKPVNEERTQDSNTKPESPGHGEGHQVLDTVEGKVCSEKGSEMEMDASFQVIDSFSEDQTATVQEDGHRAEGHGSSVKPEEVTIQVVDSSDKFAAEDASELDTDREQTPRTRGQKDGELLSEESCKQDSGPVPTDEDKDSKTNNAPEQESFEILDSIDDQTETEDEKPEAPGDQVQREDVKPVEEEEEEAYEVIDSLEDQPTTAEMKSEADNKETRTRKGNATGKRTERATRRSGPTTRTSKNEEKAKSPRKLDRTVKEYETRTRSGSTRKDRKSDENTEEMIYEIVDSVEDELVRGGEKAARGNKEVKKRSEEAAYEILDSVEDKSTDEPAVSRFTRGRRERAAKKDSSTEKTKQERTAPRRRHTPARDSQERTSEKTQKMEATLKESTPTKKSDTAFRILDSVEDGVVEVDQPTAPEKGRRRRAKKGLKTTKNQTAVLKKEETPDEGANEEEEDMYQVLDSVEDETVDDQPPTKKSKSGRTSTSRKTKTGRNSTQEEEEEEEPLYQIVDSVEDDQVQDETDASDEKKEDVHQTKATEAEDTSTHMFKEDGLHQSSSGHVEEEDKPTPEPQSDDATTGEKEEEAPQSSLVNLDEVSEEEEDYPDDTAEEEELKRRQATANEREERRSRERRSRSSSRGEGGVRKAKERRQEKEEDPQELVTLDEVGGDEADQDGASEAQDWDTAIPEGELQSLVTLDEVGEEEEEQEEEEEEEEQTLNQENQAEETFNPETSVTVDEAAEEEKEEKEEDKQETERTSRSTKRKHDDAAEESMNFVTVDEVKEEEQEEQEEEEVVTSTRSQGQAKRRTRQTPVRKSTRANDEREEEEEQEARPRSDSSSALDPDSSGPSAQNQRTEEEASSPSNRDVKGLSKQRRDVIGPEVKRSRSGSPCVAADFKLPPFPPHTPLGENPPQ